MTPQDRAKAIARNRRDYATVLYPFGWPKSPKNRRNQRFPVTGELAITPARQQYFDAVALMLKPIAEAAASTATPVVVDRAKGRISLIGGIAAVRLGVRLPGERRQKRRRSP